MKHQRILQEGSSSCRCSTTSHGDQRTTRQNASQMLNSFLYLQEDFEQDHAWSFLGLGSEKKCYSISEDSPQREWDRIAEQMMLTFAESKHPIFRSTSPLSRGQLKSKGGGKLSIHYCPNQDTITTIFRTITSVNQFSLHGTVADMCEEYESFHDRTGKPSSSFVPSVIKTKVLLDNEDRAHKDLLLQRYGERIEKLSQQDKLINFLYGCRIPDYF